MDKDEPSLTIAWTRPGADGRCDVTARINGDVLAVDRFHLADADARNRYLDALCQRYPGVEPKREEAMAELLQAAAGSGQTTSLPIACPVLLRMAEVEPRPVSWLWPGRIPLGRITLLVGRPGEGKSFLTTDLAARVTTGTPWPDGAPCSRGSVLLISAEDDPADTIRPRLDAHRADAARVHLLTSVSQPGLEGRHQRMVTLGDLDAIGSALERLNDCLLLVVDPVGSFLGSRTDAHRDNEVRGVLAPIAQLAERYGPAVLVVAHRRKSFGGTADDTALGSRAFTGIARAVWHLTRDGDDKARRLLLPGKNNLAAEGDGLAFAIAGDPPRVVWERDRVTISADDALATEAARAAKRGPDGVALGEAEAWLRAALADGPRAQKDLLDDWTNGQGGSKRTLERAKQTVGVVAYRLTVPGPWFWRLDNTAKDAKGAQLGDLGGLGANTGNTADFDPENPKAAKFPQLGGLGGKGPDPNTPPADTAPTEEDSEWGEI